MSTPIEGATHSEAFQEDLTAIALGILSGRRRSEVLAHVENCPQCSSELEHLSIVADTLLELAPEEEPPVGFELRLAQRLQASATPRRVTRLRRVSVFAAAAALVVVFGFGIGTLVGSHNGNNGVTATNANLASATLSSHGRNVGEVFLSAGKPSWMFMTIDSSSWSGVVWCELVLANGKTETIGKFGLSGGYGAWGAPLTAGAGQVRSARLVTGSGVVLASARFAA